MALVVSEWVTGEAVCTTAQRRTQLMNAASQWARRADAVGVPQAVILPDAKYGSPACRLAVTFPDRATADAAWADLAAFNPSFLKAGSWVHQFTATEDGQSINETDVHHRFDWLQDGVRSGS